MKAENIDIDAKPEEEAVDPLQDAMTNYIVARRDHEDLDARKKEAYKKFKASESQLVDMMLERGIMSQKLGNGLTLSLKKFVDFRANEANMAEILVWLEEQGEFADEYTGKSIRRARLREFLKDYIEDHGTLDIPESMDVDQRPNLSVNGWKNVFGSSNEN